METYIQLITLSPEGREKALSDPGSVLRAQSSSAGPGVEDLGRYGVLGEYDFVSIVQAEDNEAIARYSLELGVLASAHITTLPAIPVGRLERRSDDASSKSERELSLPLPDDLSWGGDGGTGPTS